MVKYRLLTTEEFKELESEFIQYLAANGIDAPKWEEIKKNTPEEVGKHIEKFSDVVMQKSLEHIRFLDCKTSSEFKLFYFADKQVHLILIKSDKVDLLKIKKLTKKELDSIELFQAKKKYETEREKEIFALLEQGCAISNGELFKQFAPLINLELKSEQLN